MTSTDTFRKFFADYITAKTAVSDTRITNAFSTVPREHFLGSGPWKVLVEDGYVTTPSDDPKFLYQDIVVAIDPNKGLNNGEPSLHARCLDTVAPKPGEAVLHVGTGTGYYTAILAELVGPEGRVVGFEIEQNLAEQATKNLASWRNIDIVCRSASEAPLPISDVIYVNAGATEPLRVWLDALSEQGRLIFPLTPRWESGGMLVVTRGAAKNVFAATFTQPVTFIPCFGGETADGSVALNEAFKGTEWRNVRSLRLDSPPDDTCWYAAENWWLSTAESS